MMRRQSWPVINPYTTGSRKGDTLLGRGHAMPTLGRCGPGRMQVRK